MSILLVEGGSNNDTQNMNLIGSNYLLGGWPDPKTLRIEASYRSRGLLHFSLPGTHFVP